jgi:ABC-2 type transport system ATP-binding protein
MTHERPGDELPDDAMAPPPVATDETASDAAVEPAQPVTDDPATDTNVSASDPDNVVIVEGVSRTFDDRSVVRDIDLVVRKGTILGIIGPSGSGKTTTIRMLTGALRPTTGDIRVLGERPARFRRSTRERIGYMPQLFTLYPDLSARENVDFVASLFGLLWPRRRRRTKEVLKLLELWDARNRRAGKMSGGMQRRLELACALVHDPALLILDEPTAGIDPLLRVTIWAELHRLRDEGRTLLVTTQYVNEAEECDQVALIANGRLVALAPPEELRQQASGGQIVEVETAGLFEASSLGTVPGIVAVEQVGPHKLRFRVEDAATGLPAVVDAIGAAGGDVEAASEVRLSFDQIFAELVERANAEDAASREASSTGEESAA